MSPCPSEMALEALLLRAPPSGVVDHVDRCERCKARIADANEISRAFATQVYPLTLERVLREATLLPWWKRRRMGWVLVPALVVALAVLLPWHRGPSGDYVGTKGGFSFSVFVDDGQGARVVHEGESIAPGEPLRFRVRPMNACHLWIVSADATGAVSRLFPADGEGGAVVQQGPLPGGATLDGHGPERFFAICTPNPIDFAALSESVRHAVSPDAASVRAVRTLPDLPAGSQQATLLVEKTP